MAFKIDDTLLQMIKLNLLSPRVAPFLGGEPGIGKTEAINALRNDPSGKYAVFSLDVNTLSDKGDLNGVRTVPTADGKSYEQVFFPHQVIREANEHAVENPEKTVVLLLDEINRTDSDVTSAALTLVTSRRCGSLRFAPNLRFMLTGNLRGNVTMLDSASLTRFALYEVEPDAQTFIDVIEAKKDLHPFIKEVLTQRPDYIFCKPIKGVTTGVVDEDDEDDPDAQAKNFEAIMADEQDMSQYTAPRTIEGLNDWLTAADETLLRELLVTNVTGPDGREASMLTMALQAHTGNTAFTAAVAEKLANKLVSTPAGATATGPVLVRPAVWDAFVSGTRTDIERIVGSIDAKGQGEIFLYALGTTRDADVVKAVIDVLTGPTGLEALETDQSAAFMRNGLNGDLQTTALQYFYSKVGSPLVASLEVMKVHLGVS